MSGPFKSAFNLLEPWRFFVMRLVAVETYRPAVVDDGPWLSRWHFIPFYTIEQAAGGFFADIIHKLATGP